MKKKVLITGANGMLAFDFQRYYKNDFEIIGYDKENLDITNIGNIDKVISDVKPDVILNCAAYTNVDDAEDIGKKLNFDVNTIGVFYLAKIASKYDIDYITISTDYVFDGNKIDGYNEKDECNPINNYGLSKYLGEQIALQENKNTIIIRTSWLYGGGMKFKNFVNTMLKLAEVKTELKIVGDQFGLPTFTKDLCLAIFKVINDIGNNRGKIFHFSNSGKNAITWFDFANEIFNIIGKDINIVLCSSNEFKTKAIRPKCSLMLNNSEIKLRDWKEGLRDYFGNLYKCLKN